MQTSKKVKRLRVLSSILSQEFQLGLNDQSVELGLDNLLSNSYKDMLWIRDVYPMKSRNYKNLGVGERHIWVKNLISKISYEIKIIEEKISNELLVKNLPLENTIETNESTINNSIKNKHTQYFNDTGKKYDKVSEIMDNANSLVKLIEKDTVEIIELESKKINNQIENEILNKAVKLAEHELSSDFDESKDTQIIKSFLGEVRNDVVGNN